MNEQNTTMDPIYPVGNQDFKKIRSNGYVYVDKTKYIYQLAQASKYVFLNRPRLFGKSLLCSTMKYYFEGCRELFKGLAVEQLEHDWTQYPVIYLSLSSVKFNAPKDLPRSLRDLYRFYEKEYGPLKGIDPGECLSELTRKLYKLTGRGVVIIIDEYDSPLLNHLENQEDFDSVLNTLQELFSPLKDLDPYLHFCFITGITKFPQPSIFSSINNLRNISLLDQFAAICGITENELHQNLEPGVTALSQELECSVDECYAKLKELYNGYHFAEDSEDIYNPFALICALDDRKLSFYWFETAVPIYLIQLLKHYNTDLTQLDGKSAYTSQFDVPTEAITTVLPILYQSGYLTIKGYDPMMRSYTLGIPNNEVRVGLAEYLLPAFTEVNSDTMNGIQSDFCEALINEDLEVALTSMRSYFAAIPYPEGGKEILENEESAEWHYSSIFYLLFSFMNYTLRTEVKSARGRADMVMYTAHTIYVFEFKVNHSADEALKQIDEKGYMVPYEADARKLVKCGVEFSSKLRTLKEWKIVNCK
jgi:hypothetical protein